MPRPKRLRRTQFKPNTYYFKPRGIPMRELAEVIVEADEMEAIKLYEVDGLDQTESAKKMDVSQPTFARILNRANKKIADALVNGKAIRLEEK